MTTSTVAELMDAKDEAVEARLETKIAQAVADVRRDIQGQTLWIVGWVTVVGATTIAVLR